MIVKERIDPEFGPFSYVYEQEIKLNKVCYFAGHTVFTEYLDYVYDYLERIIEIGYEIIFISSSPLSDQSIVRLKNYCAVIIQKTNAGVDFGAWKIGLSETDYAEGYDSLILVNDSVFGPMRSLKEDAERLSKAYDLWGYSINLEQAAHVQSYFLCCNKKMIDSGFVRRFWEKVILMAVKDEWIIAYEIGFSQEALKNNFTIGAIADARDLKDGLKLPSPNLNYTISAWKELIVKYNFPILKREVLIKDIAQATNGGWGDVITTVFPDYPLRYIDEYLEKYEAEILSASSIPFGKLRKDIICLSHLAKKVTSSQLLCLSIAHDLARSMNQPLLCYQLTSSKYNTLLDSIELPLFVYLGSLNVSLLEQYIYQWNRYNVRGLIIDDDTYRLYGRYFQNFYCGNIWVVSEEDNFAHITYFIRGEKISFTKAPLIRDNIIATEPKSINLISNTSFRESYQYAIIQKYMQDQGLELGWQDIHPISMTPNDSLYTILFNDYNFVLLHQDKEIYSTEDPQDLCNQITIEMNSSGHDESKIALALGTALLDLKEIANLYNRCFLHKEHSLNITAKTASFIHFYYEDSLYDLLPYIYNLSYLHNHSFFFSISEETSNRKQIARKLIQIFPGCYIQIVKNTGKDIGGKLNLLKLYFELGLESDYLLLLHDKKSLHSWSIDGNQWRTELFKIAEPEYIAQIILLFRNSPKLGLLGNDKWLNNTDYDYSMSRFAHHDAFMKERLKKYGVSIKNYQFIAGTMFWIRDELMRSFFKRYSLLEILEKLEHGNMLDSKEGTETHFLERFFGWYSTSEDFELSGI